jgi:hypothetical protein
LFKSDITHCPPITPKLFELDSAVDEFSVIADDTTTVIDRLGDDYDELYASNTVIYAYNLSVFAQSITATTGTGFDLELISKCNSDSNYMNEVNSSHVLEFEFDKIAPDSGGGVGVLKRRLSNYPAMISISDLMAEFSFGRSDLCQL